MKTKIWIALLALYFVWGSTYLGIRITIETIPPFLQAGIRFLVSGLILLIWRISAGDALPTKKQWKSAAVIGLLLLLGGNGLVSWAQKTVASGVAALIVSSIPIWMLLIDALRPGGVKPKPLSILGLITGLAGIFLLVGPDKLTGARISLDLFGMLALLAAAFLWSLGSVYSKSADLPNSTLMSTGAQMVVGSLGLFLVSGLSGEWSEFSFLDVSLRSALGLAYLIGFGSLIGFVAYGWLLRNAPISLVSTYAYVNPLIAVLLGNTLMQEPITPRILLAGAAIITSVMLVNFGGRQKKISPKMEESRTG